MAAEAHISGGERLPRSLLLVLSALAAVAPLSTTMYLPGMPAMADDLGASASGAQLTVSAFVIGLALGQLLSGPLSDRFGRRRPLLTGLTVYVAAALGCAAAPSVTLLIVARFALGLSGSAGIVIARACVRDLRSGAAAVRLFAALVLVTGVAPVVAPLMGGQLLALGSWRTIFLGIAAVAATMTAATLFVLPETLPGARRRSVSMTETLSTPARLLRERTILGSALACGMAYAAMLSYIAGSSFALQDVYGLSPAAYSACFAFTALGLIGASRLTSLLVGRVGTRRLLLAGTATSAAGGALAVAGVIADLPVGALLPALMLTVAAHGLVLPNATGLALAGHPQAAGSASAALGVVQYATGALVAPLTGVGGSTTALPMVIVMAALGAGSLCAAVFVIPRPVGARVSSAEEHSVPAPTAG